MKKNKIYKLWSGLLPLLFLMLSVAMQAQSFLINFPAFSSSPTKNPQDITVCNGTSKLQVQMSAGASSASGAEVTIQLAAGMEYVAGSATVVSSNAGLTITENGGTANAPKFKIANASGAIANSNNIVFTIDRRATCTARTQVINGTVFKDTVTGTIPGNTASTELSGSYDVKYAVLSFTQPTSLNNAIVGQTATRTFSVTNGGNGATNAIHFSIEYVNAGIVQNSLTLTGGSGSTGTPVTLTPTSTVGNISYYTIPAANLSGGNLDNGEVLTFSENFTVKKCDPVTNYKVGWGCNAAPADWCETKSGTGNVTMLLGTAALGPATGAKIGYVNMCTPYITRITYQNAGTTTTAASGMYDIKLRMGSTNGGVTFNATSFRSAIQYLGAAIGTVSGLTVNNGTINTNYSEVNLANHPSLFGVDPDGAGVGLDDLDGDGYYDDLPSGKTVTLDLNTQINCNWQTTCPLNISNFYDQGTQIVYNNMCGISQQTSLRTYPSIATYGYTSVASKSYAPANIYGGVPFRARFAYAAQNFATNFNTANTRYVYEITLPVGVAVSGTGNIRWRNGIYPNDASSGGAALTYTQSGNVISVTSPSINSGWIEIDLVYICSGTPVSSLQIPFKLKYINDISSSPQCVCNSEMLCSTLDIANVVCPGGSCPVQGPSLNFVKVERADNSLGWTDGTLATRQSRSAISNYDLSKALYLDEIWVNANATYGANGQGLFQRFAITKTVGTDDKLQPLDIKVIVKRGGTEVANTTLTVFNGTGSNNTQQVTNWDLSQVGISIGGFQSGDIIETRARYQVTSRNLPAYDLQTGKDIFFYSLDTDNVTELSCNRLVPEMYLATINFAQSFGAANLTSCNTTSVGGIVAQRFDSNGIIFLNEFRPSLRPKKYTQTIPAGYTFVGMKWNGQNQSFSSQALSYTQSGNTYTVNNIPYKPFPITIANNFNFNITADIAPSCSTPSSTNGGATLEYIPYYYHYADDPNAPTQTYTTTQVYNYDTSTRPSITLSNLSGNIQATKPTESFTFRINSTGITTAPYVWVSVPTVAGVNPTQVIDLATNTVISPVAYSGGTWFQVSAAGLAAGTFRDFRIDFTYTSCTTSSFTVNAGWGCSGYPSNPDVYGCNPASINLQFIPIPGEVQVLSGSQPATPLSGLCAPLNYVFRLNSAGGGNLKDVKFAITQISGVTVTPSTIQAEYPAGAGNWSAVSYTTSGNDILLDLTTHPAYPATGLPGTLNDGGNANNRLIGVRFSITTDCNFVSGSNFTVTPFAKNTCGTDTTGNGSKVATGSLNVSGADPSYLVASTISVNPATAFDNCASPINLPIEQTITSVNPTGSTGTVRIDLPLGYEFVAPVISCTSAFCPTVDGVYTNAVTGTKYMVLKVPAGMNSGDKLIYTVQIQNSAIPITCGDHTISIKTFDKTGSISCPSASGGTCTDVTVQTGKFDLNFSIKKPTYSIDVLSGVLSGGTFAGSVKISNTSVYNSTNPISITFYCADAAGNPTSTVFGTATIATPVAAGANATYTYSFTPATTCNSGNCCTTPIFRNTISKT